MKYLQKKMNSEINSEKEAIGIGSYATDAY